MVAAALAEDAVVPVVLVAVAEGTFHLGHIQEGVGANREAAVVAEAVVVPAPVPREARR